MAVTGYLHSLQSLGAVDGPGLRYVVFLQGCPSRCIYCHNPDTWDFSGGTPYEPAAVVEKILRYRSYLKNGGVTVTGGEPLSQPEFVAELFRLLQAEGIHTALDTSGVGAPDTTRQVLQYTNLVLADVKFCTADAYRRYCGIDFSQVVQFLTLVREMGIPMWARHVVVPGLNDTPEDIRSLAAFLAAYPNTEKVELLPFRKLCLEKYRQLSIPFPLENTPEASDAEMTRLAEYLPPPLR